MCGICDAQSGSVIVLQVIQYSLISIILPEQHIISFIHLFNHSFNVLFYLVITLLPTLYNFSI
jgi:hypothetical protein